MLPAIGILGLGYLGSELVNRYQWPEDSWGSHPQPHVPESSVRSKLRLIHFDWNIKETWDNIPAIDANIVLTIPPPTQDLEKEIQWLIVWGGWMNRERSKLRQSLTPDTDKGKLRAESEKVLRHFFDLRVVRSGAIYGPGRHIGKRIMNRKPIPRGGQPIHRIHVRDLAQIIKLALTQKDFPQVVNAVDEEAAPTEEVVNWLIRQPFFPHKKSDKIRFQEEYCTRKNLPECSARKISNRCLKSISEFQYHYPTYREGIKQSVEANQ